MLQCGDLLSTRKYTYLKHQCGWFHRHCSDILLLRQNGVLGAIIPVRIYKHVIRCPDRQLLMGRCGDCLHLDRYRLMSCCDPVLTGALRTENYTTTKNPVPTLFALTHGSMSMRSCATCNLHQLTMRARCRRQVRFSRRVSRPNQRKRCLCYAGSPV